MNNDLKVYLNNRTSRVGIGMESQSLTWSSSRGEEVNTWGTRAGIHTSGSLLNIVQVGL